ncbi:DUF58 domain-containing protein [Thermomonospora cellulosilytica]|uniref:Uncharacterized protein (DUF58 family) n=1 Tax=Thermomonospora cellulosilytica TaxID=1411118 RepID=A0A7W3R9K8_9ACTN|nr:DUF58 domain-containing protein [Thermomonospora cellulosilytica]MBA9004862.1 uncharacterized protein (DUF58 family) [Thermomonospora cellulosilytica]
MTAPALRELAPEEALRRLELTVLRRLDGLLQGDHLGLVPGPGTEAAEGRPYAPGDDVRAMDWNLTARAAEPHVRDRIADRELETWALVDATASMDFGTGRVEKRDLAVAAVAALGFLTERSGNRIGAHVLRGDGARRVPARTGRSHLLALLRTLLAAGRAPAGDAARLGAGIDLVRRTTLRRGLVAVVSDFLEPPGTWERPLRLLARRHQVLAVEVLDPRELTLPDVGVLAVVDPETGRRREIPTASARVRERYALAAAAQRAAIARAVVRAGAAHLRLRTDGDWVRDIARHAHLQRRLAAAPPPGGAPA